MNFSPPEAGLFTSPRQLVPLLAAAIILWTILIFTVRTLIAHDLIWPLAALGTLIFASLGFSVYAVLYAHQLRARSDEVEASGLIDGAPHPVKLTARPNRRKAETGGPQHERTRWRQSAA